MPDRSTPPTEDRDTTPACEIALALSRLPPADRTRVRVLGVCHGGVQYRVLGALPGLDPEKALELFMTLIELGLANDAGHGHLRLDPALAPYLVRELDTAELEETRLRWARAVRELSEALCRLSKRNAAAAAELASMELPNVVAGLEELRGGADDGVVADLTRSVEALTQVLAESARGAGQSGAG